MARLFVLFFASILVTVAQAGASAALHAPREAIETRHGWMDAHANRKDAWLYVAGFANNVVSVYDLQQLGTPLIGRLTQGLKNPCGLAIDSQGTLYVTNEGANTVEVFPAGATSRSLTLSKDLDLPVAVTIDINGDVYVANDSATNPGIAVFPAGQTDPSAYITSNLLPQPIQMFFDAARTLYVSDLDTALCVYNA